MNKKVSITVGVLLALGLGAGIALYFMDRHQRLSEEEDDLYDKWYDFILGDTASITVDPDLEVTVTSFNPDDLFGRAVG